MVDSFIYKFAATIADIALLFPFIPIIFALIITTRAYLKIKWALVVLMLGGVSIDLILRFGSSYGIHIETNLLYNAYTVLCIIISNFVFSTIIRNTALRVFMSATFLSILIGIMMGYIVYQDTKMESSTAYSIFSIVIIILSMLYFRNLLNKLEVPNLLKHPYFWVVFAFLWYFGGTLILTLFQNYIHDAGTDLLLYLWPIQIIAGIIFTLLISKSIWTMRIT